MLTNEPYCKVLPKNHFPWPGLRMEVKCNKHA